MRVLVAMSGGVDSSVAAAELLRAGHQVTGITMRLWGGDSDTGCCSVSDVDDARRVAQQLGIDHVVFNFSDDFEQMVVQPYVDAHRDGTTPNPCIECNRHLKFHRLAERADVLGFDAVATGHHAAVTEVNGVRRIQRGADAAKDQSYVVHMLSHDDLARTMFPVGSMTKSEVRSIAAELGLRTATKPDSQDVCFITTGNGREAFLGARIPLHRARVVDRDGAQLGEVPAVEMVTLGQRRGIGLPGGGPKRFVVAVGRDPEPTVVVGDEADLLRSSIDVAAVTWSHLPVEGEVLVQCSAHGTPRPARTETADGSPDRVRVVWEAAQRAVAPGQTVVFYDSSDRYVLGGGIAR